MSINHPGLYKLLQYFDYHCAAATPPSKGGESIINLLNFIIKMRLPLRIFHVIYCLTLYDHGYGV
jgi:hypothetical protein